MDLGSLNSTYIPCHKVSSKIVEQLKGQMGLNLHIPIAKLRGIEKMQNRGKTVMLGI
jgi:hypothetical protein